MADISDAELLSLCAQEKRQSIGMENDAELSDARIQALDYYKGEVPDMPARANRSKAVSTDVADAIHTVMPDLVEIFTGGEDVVTFQPQGPEDEDAAAQETDYLSHVVMNENSGFLLFNTACQDALLSKVGVFKWWWEGSEAVEEEEFVKSAAEYEAMLPLLVEQGDEPQDVRPFTDADGTAYVAFVLRKSYEDGCAKVMAVPPEDFTVARDTVDLKNATYCAMRSRPRAQDLIAQGYEPDLVAQLPAYGAPSYSDGVQQARDTAGEQSENAGTIGDLRLVEIVEHNIRVVDDETREPVIWRVVTGGDEAILLHREKIERIQFAAITPYPQTHRFYGRSLADLLLEIQRIKTALTRMLLDSGYFALNQRLAVDMTKAHPQFTIADLLRNEPGSPVRVNGQGAVTPIQAGGLGFDAAGALELFSTVAEQRTGIVRNAQGLKPDTLHDTAQGAMALMSNAQKRVRMIARIFAETGVKDMFLGVHALLRQHAQREKVVRLRNEWVPINPTSWGERSDMSVEIGVGSGGQQEELQRLMAAKSVVTELVAAQGGFKGPFITEANAYAFFKRLFERGFKFKSADAVISDPAKAQPQQEGPPPPDPETVKAQMDFQMRKYEADQKASVELEKARLQDARERERMAMEYSLKQQEITTQTRLKAAEVMTGANVNEHVTSAVRFGGSVG